MQTYAVPIWNSCMEFYPILKFFMFQPITRIMLFYLAFQCMAHNNFCSWN